MKTNAVQFAAIGLLLTVLVFLPTTGFAAATPSITTQPQGRTNLIGSDVAFVVDASGQLPLSYQWSFNGTNLTNSMHIGGATNAALTISNVVAGDAGGYQVEVSNSHGSVISSNATLTAVFPAAVTGQPVSQSVLLSSNVVFTVSATGTAILKYKWYFNGSPLADGGRVSGSSTTNLNLANAQSSDAGAYQVVVTNDYSSATSALATLAVILPPTITNQPVSRVVLPGGNATFAAGVSGTGPFTYQWQLNGTNLPNGIITTVAGNGTTNFSGDGGAATDAGLNSPAGVLADASGNLFIADTLNQCVRKVGVNGIIMTVAGGGSPIYPSIGDDGAATNASLIIPTDMAVDSNGNLFILEAYMWRDGDNRIRKVNTDGIITTVAGGGTNGFGDGGAATNAELFATGLALDAKGNLYIAESVADRVRKVDTNSIISAMAGNGTYGYFSGDGGPATNAGMYNPSTVAVDNSGNLFIADSGNNRIRKVNTNGIITTVVGKGPSGFGTGNYSGDGGAATNASLNWPSNMAMDASGNLFIVDFFNQRIRKVDTSGIITTFAGNGTTNFLEDGGAATNASLNNPIDVALDTAGNLFIADNGNNRIRKVSNTRGPVLALNNVSPADAGSYQVVVTGPGGSVTSSVASLTLLLLPQNFTGQFSTAGLQLQFAGTPNYPYILQATTNLTPPINWQSILTNPADGSGNWSFMVTNLSAAPARFYRTFGQ
jgi:hypothetical protein